MLNVSHRSEGHSCHRGNQAIEFSILTNAPQITKAVKENVLDHTLTLKAFFGNSTYHFYPHFIHQSKSHGHTQPLTLEENLKAMSLSLSQN